MVQNRSLVLDRFMPPLMAGRRDFVEREALYTSRCMSNFVGVPLFCKWPWIVHQEDLTRSSYVLEYNGAAEGLA